MKRELLPAVCVTGLNIVFIAVCFFFFWLPSYNAVSLGLDSLELKERMLEIKENNLAEYEANTSALEELREELAGGNAVPVPYSNAMDVLSGLSLKAGELGLTEDSFFMGEPTVHYAAELTVSILEVSAGYYGTYEKLCEFLKYVTDNPLCVTGAFKISRQYEDTAEEESYMTVEITLYALAE